MSKGRKQEASLEDTIRSKIYSIRRQRVILDSDLARIYCVKTARLNQQVRRNRKKFPKDFVFNLSKAEFKGLMLQNATSKGNRGGRTKIPMAFTEHGAIMAATVLSSERAVAMSVYVVRAFVKFRKLLSSNQSLAKKLALLEKTLNERLDVHEVAIFKLFAEIQEILNPAQEKDDRPKGRIGFKAD